MVTHVSMYRMYECMCLSTNKYQINAYTEIVEIKHQYEIEEKKEGL